MSNPNEAVVRRWFEEVWGCRLEATVRELLTEESVLHGKEGPVIGPEPWIERMYRPLLAAFPDLQVVIEELMSEGAQVAVRWCATGTHTGDGLGIPASGERVTFRGMGWIRLCGGKLAEGWDFWDQGGLLLSLRGGAHPNEVPVS